MEKIVSNEMASNGDLDSIRGTVQHVVSAIAAVLGVEVAIIDNNFQLLATSKTFLETRGIDINVEFIKAVYRKGVAVIPNPGEHDFCIGCKNEGKCPETAEVLRVIEHGGKNYGVILLVAYTNSQKEKLLNNTSELLEFISEMTNLIYDEILLQKSLEKEKFIKRQFQTTINFVDTGIITIDRQGRITQINGHARTVLGLSDDQGQGKLLNDYIPAQLVSQLIHKGKEIKRCEVQTNEPCKIHCMISANPIAVSGKLMGAVLHISDFRELCSTVYEFSAQHIDTTLDDILGDSVAIQQAKAYASTVARNDSTVLIMGESGTGKELFARAIHTNSSRAEYPFIAINCAAIPEALLESELFGYNEGAFSGAIKGGKPGKFEMAAGGTLFLDEIGDMPLHMQAKILRVLQEGVLERLGGVKIFSVDIRVIAATNRDLEQLVKEGSFREDLFYRLNVVPILTPPLRERKADIVDLSNCFFKNYNVKMKRNFDSISQEAMEMLMAHHWPGNVRELQNAIEYAVNVETQSTIRSESLPINVLRHGTPKRLNKPLAEKVREFESLLIKEAMDQFDYSVEGKKLTAKKLGISLPTLYRKLKEYGM